MNGKISNLGQVASICRYTVTNGAGAGLDILDCNNGTVRFLINVSKACDLMQLYHEGQNMSFLSKNGFTKRELGFLNRFEGGMLYTCGLDSIGGREGYELHGSFHNTPAEVIRAEANEKEILVEAVIRNTALFGKNLVMRRRITSKVGEGTVTVEDRLTNEGSREEDYCLLYHINVGYPMLDEGARIVADTEESIPRTPWSAQHIDSMYQITDSVANEEECCYFLKLKRPEVALENQRIGKKLSVSYSAQTLPHFVEWRSMASGDYAVGLEPCTTELDDRFQYRTIAPGETIPFCVQIKVEKI